MSTPRTLAETLVDAEALVASMEFNADQLPPFDAEKAEINQHLTELKQLATRRDNFRVEKQVINLQLKETKARVLDAMANLRLQLKGKLGRNNEKNKEFGVSPNRGAGGRKKKNPDAPAPVPAQAVQAVQTTALPVTPVALVVTPAPAATPTSS